MYSSARVRMQMLQDSVSARDEEASTTRVKPHRELVCYDSSLRVEQDRISMASLDN